MLTSTWSSQREERARERAIQEQAHNAEVNRLERELREKYPWAGKDSTLSRQAQAAASLRQELALAFPGVKFSVTSKSASMTNSVRYEWSLGPTGDQVEAIASKYEYGRYDGAQDLATFDNSAFGDAVERVLGRAKYVSGYRDIPESIHEQIGRLLCEAQHVQFAGDQTEHVFGQGDTRLLRDHVREILSRTSFPLNSEIAGIIWKDSGYNEMTGEDVQQSGYHLTFKDCDHNETIYPNKRGPGLCAKCGYVYGSATGPSPDGTDVSSAITASGITVSENTAKAGIEIRFESKPSQTILDLIHAQGHGVWRWHKRGKYWYAKANDSTRAFAQSLIGGTDAN